MAYAGAARTKKTNVAQWPIFARTAISTTKRVMPSVVNGFMATFDVAAAKEEKKERKEKE
jgi:hypothetical protein